MNQILEEISNIGVVPVVAIDHKDDAAPLADALTKGGLPCAEVTFRTPAAEESIRIMAEQFPDMLLGAGTVLTTEQADRAIVAGAKFIVSPGFNPKVVSHCIEKNIPITPGISSPSDMEQAIEMGLDAVKFFPAVPSGGLSMIKALAAPYHTMRFMPTGGVTPQNLTEFLDYPKILACGGTWMVKPELLATGNFEEITRLTRQTVRTMLDLKIDELTLPFPHTGNNLSDALHGLINLLSGSTKKLTISCRYLKRTIYHLEKNGATFRYDNAKYDSAGNMDAIDFSDAPEEFSIRLIEKH